MSVLGYTRAQTHKVHLTSLVKLTVDTRKKDIILLPFIILCRLHVLSIQEFLIWIKEVWV